MGRMIMFFLEICGRISRISETDRRNGISDEEAGAFGISIP
jgi:hypothetical protein